MSEAIVKPPRANDIDLSVPPNFRSIKGKTIAITGGASGFGKAMALLWASKGWVTLTPPPLGALSGKIDTD
jgi:hypothetical protein